MAAKSISGRHSSASYVRPSSSLVAAPDMHPGGVQSAHHSRANSRQHQHHRHHHHHHHRRRSRGEDQGISFISETDIKRPKSRQVKHEDDLLNSVPDHDLVMVPTDPEKQFCKRSQHQYLPGQGDHALFSPPSSTSSGTDSSLRIRRSRSTCTERRWFISVSLAMVITLVIASGGIYFGYQFLKSHLPTEADEQIVYKGEFIVTRGDFIPIASDASGLSFVQTEKAKFYQMKLDQIFSASHISKSFLFNEILLLEGLTERGGSNGVKVHFNIHMSSPEGKISVKDIYSVLREQINGKDPAQSFLAELDIDEESLVIEERSPDLPPPHLRESGIDFNHEPDDVKHSYSNIKGQCIPFVVDYCKELPYNYTIFPNGLGHVSLEETNYVLESFKTIIASKCHNLGYEFLCQLLQPVCYLENMVLPCRDFCIEFTENCQEYIPNEIKAQLDCDKLATEADGPSACISKPGCVAELRNAAKTNLICDGVVDCPDFSDELYCPYCPEHHFHCGVAKTCIPKEKLCDGISDCDNGADERGCLSLSHHGDFASYVHQYYQSGYLTYQDSGEVGRVCADHINSSVTNTDEVLARLGESTCAMLEYQELVDINIIVDTDIESKTKYVDIVSPISADKNFINADCSQRNVVNITCDKLQCGQRPSYVPDEFRSRLESRRDIAVHGDWPWMVALYKNGLHVCDATLVDQQWIMTTASCFQGQAKAKWTARFASVRLQSRAPWEQKRTIIGMVKSPVEGNSIVLLKLDQQIVFSDFARPICIPDQDDFINASVGTNCITLGWSLDTDELAKVYVNPTNTSVCEEISEVSANTICTKEDTAPGIPCSGEEFAGAPLMCQHMDSWYLAGILAWRKGCSTVGQRPRLYDRVAVTSQWAHKVMLKLNDRMPRHNH